MRLPVRVQGRDAGGAVWDEITTCEDANPHGIGLRLRRPVQVGQVLHLSLPFPRRLRQYDLNDPSYRVYALVRNVRPEQPAARVGLMLLGKQPPRGTESRPSGLFLMPNDPAPVERRKFDRQVVVLAIRLEGSYAAGGVVREERTMAENLGKWGAQVKTSLPVAKGDVVVVQEAGGFRTRAEIRSVTIGPDGSPRLNLLFLDEQAPDRLIPAPAEGG
jgi:hypothetical protein